MKYDTAGDPMTGLKWTQKTTGKIAVELRSLGICVSGKTVGKLLKKMGFSLRVNHKNIDAGNHGNRAAQKKRDRQFRYIRNLREKFGHQGAAIISVDTKKKELVGNFKNQGVSWERDARQVNDHDFPSQSDGKGIPYGIYDIQANRGSVFVGTTRDTSAFAVEAIEKWWRQEGIQRYPGVNKLLILADCGGSNSARSRAWKYNLQEILCNPHGIIVTVCHYPPGTSKWNPIEHRLFSEISKNWSGKPLVNYETMLKHIRTTKTTTGLKVSARLVKKKYRLGQTVSNLQMSKLSLKKHAPSPEWNYTLLPAKM